MSAKKVCLSAEYDKIRRRQVVYCPPKGVKSMIEVIYKNEEQGQTKEKQDNFKIPNNIRQIGEIKTHLRIYIEDYAYTFLKKLSQTGKEEGETAVLFGERHWKCGEEYIFIKSALRIEDIKITEEQMVFTEKIWSWVYENGREYFPGQNVMGWFLHIPEYNVQITELVRRTHEANFAGKDKVLFIMDPAEQEEAFYTHENSMLQRQSGFYVYYEKNEPMQSYMIAYNKNKSIEDTEKTPDRAVIDFRKVFAQKEEENEEDTTPQSGKASKTLQICAAIALVVLGGTAYNHYRTIQSTSGIESAANADTEEDALSVNAGAQMADQGQDKTLTREEDTESASAANTVLSTQGIKDEEAASSENGNPNGDGALDTENGESGDDAVNSQSTANTNSTSAAGSTQTGDDVSGSGREQSDVSTSVGGSTSTDKNTESEGNTSGSKTEESGSANAGTNTGGTANSSNTDKSQNAQQTTASGMQEYTIRRGDTLTGICQQKYGSIQRMDEVCEINNIKPEDIIYAGQKIFLPD